MIRFQSSSWTWMLVLILLRYDQPYHVTTAFQFSISTVTPGSGSVSSSYSSYSSSSSSSMRRRMIKFNPNIDDEDPGYKRGYQFGDVTKGFIRKFGQTVTSVTGKDEYEFGDLSKWLDQQAKLKVKEFTNSSRSSSGNDDYQFGDITKEIIRRVQQGEYTQDDLVLLLKIIVTIGIELQPIARVLPVKVVLELLNVSIAQEMSGKAIGVLTNELDSRMKQVLTGDKDYQIGDFTKKAITGGSKDYQLGDFTKQKILQFTGKESYTFGDITRTFLAENNNDNDDDTTSGSNSTSTSTTNKSVIPSESTSATDSDGTTSSNNNNNNNKKTERKEIVLDDQLLKDLESWDAKFLESRQQEQNKADDSLSNNSSSSQFST